MYNALPFEYPNFRNVQWILFCSYSIVPLDEEAELGAEEDFPALSADAEECGLSSDNEDLEDSKEVVRASAPEVPLHVLPLYSLLSTDKQEKACVYIKY